LLEAGLGFFLEEKYFFPSHGRNGRNWEETPK